MANAHDVTLLTKTICDDLVIARFSRPDGYSYRAGQWFRLGLQTAEGVQTRTFSHASAPGDPYIELATRLSGSSFKRALCSLTEGELASLSGPGGRLSLPAGADEAVFLAGGVGITPVRSMLRDAVQLGARFSDALVVYGNRTAECVAYLEELEAMRHSGVRVIPVYEAGAPAWQGETGFITPSLLRRHLDVDAARPFIVAGPPPMVAAMVAALDELGIGPELRMIESFGRI